MSTALISSLLGLIFGSLGALLIEWYKNRKSKERELSIKYNEIMENKYRYLLISMQCVLDYKNRRYFNLIENEPLKSTDDYLEQLRTYYYNSLLYSSEDVLKSIKTFIAQPNEQNFILAALAMRNEIWGKQNKMTYEQINLSRLN